MTYVTAYAVAHSVHFSLVGKIPTRAGSKQQKPFDKHRAGFGWSTRVWKKPESMSRKSKQPDEWLDTLLPARQFPQTPLIPGGGTVTTSEAILEIPLDSLDANPYQTRTVLDEKSLDELADSIEASD